MNNVLRSMPMYGPPVTAKLKSSDSPQMDNFGPSIKVESASGNSINEGIFDDHADHQKSGGFQFNATKGDMSLATMSGSHVSLSPDTKDRFYWGIGIAIVLLIAIAGGSAAGINSLPMGPYYARGEVLSSEVMFIGACFFIGPALGVTCTIWLRTMNDLPTKQNMLAMWLPGINYLITVVPIYMLIMYAGAWPMPMLPVIGATSFAAPVCGTVYYQLPAELKELHGFKIRFIKMIIIAFAMNVFWFVLLAFYFCFSFVGNSDISSGWSSFLQIMLLIIFRFATEGMIHVRRHLAEHVMDRAKESTKFRIGMLAQFEIDAAYELYSALVLPDVESVIVYIGMLLIDCLGLWVTLLRDPRKRLKHLLLFKNCVNLPNLEMLNSTRPEDKKEREKAQKRSRALMAASQEFFMEVVAKLYGAVSFMVMLPLLYFRPNNTWMVFTYGVNDLLQAVYYNILTVGVLTINVVGAFYLVKKQLNLNLISRGLETLDGKMLQLMICIYLFIPCLVTTHMGKQWDTVTFLDGIFSAAR